jgi:F-type H+-transporting ATPase subunit b
MRHDWSFRFALLAILTVTWAVLDAHLVRAADEAHETKSAGAHKGGDEPPPIFTPVRIDLAVWTLVVFLLLLFVLTKYAWNPMLGALQKREENVRSAIDEAQRARDDAHQIREQLATERGKIAEETRAAIEAARKDAQQLRESMLTQAKVDIQAERDRLHREIDSARDQALKQLWDQTAQLATLISAKAIRRQLSPDDHRRLLDEALADMRNAGGAHVG